MIVNIPLQIDEKVIEQNLNVDYEAKIENYIFKEVESALIQRADGNRWYGSKGTTTEGITLFVHEYVDKYIQEWKDEIIEAAAKNLADRLVKTKKGKEVLEHYCVEDMRGVNK